MKRIITKNWLPLMATFLIAFSLTLVGAQVFKTVMRNMQSKDEAEQQQEEQEAKEEDITGNMSDTNEKTFIDLQPLVDEWAKNTEAGGRNRKIGIMIYDLDNNRVAASYNANEVFTSASIYKLFFVYDGYQQIDQGAKKSNELFINTEDKGRLTYGECLDYMIRESYSPCADAMRNDTEIYDRIEDFIQKLDLKDTSDAGLYSTPRDLIEFLQYIYQHDDLSEESWQKLSDSMLNQPETTYDWRQGLPAGFNRTLVYDKVGWLWSQGHWAEYNDAAILEFPSQDRHYAIVVMTEGLPNTTPLIALGNRLEETILSAE